MITKVNIVVKILRYLNYCVTALQLFMLWLQNSGHLINSTKAKVNKEKLNYVENKSMF